jgi:hypothetical protein
MEEIVKEHSHWHCSPPPSPPIMNSLLKNSLLCEGKQKLQAKYGKFIVLILFSYDM